MKDYNDLYKEILKKLFMNNEFAGMQINKNSAISHYDHATRTIHINAKTNFVSKLLTPKLGALKDMFENATGRTVDLIMINNNVAYSDKKTLEDIVVEQTNVTEQEAKVIVETIEKTFEDELLVVEQANNSQNDNVIVMKFYNSKVGATKNVVYVKGDHKYRDDLTLGWMFLPILVGIPFLVKGFHKKTRLRKVQKQLTGLKMLKFEPVNKDTAKIAKTILEVK